jgi:acyl carrier protein
LAAEERPSDQGGKPPQTRADIFNLVRGIIADQLGVDKGKVKEKASLQEDLDADSLDLVELIMELEDQTGVKISDEDALKITTVGEAVDYICKALGVEQ